MKKNLARKAAGEVTRGSTAASWVAVIITAIAAVVAWNPNGHTHHWVWMLVILIIGIPVAGILERRKR